MIKGYQTEILSIYDKIRDQESKALRKRKDEISEKYPEIIELDQQIQKLSLQMALAVIKANDKDKTLNSYKDRITDLRIKKCEMLVERGYNPEYLNIHYHCDKCNDTGFIGNKKCTCYSKMLVKLYYKDSELENVIKTANSDLYMDECADLYTLDLKQAILELDELTGEVLTDKILDNIFSHFCIGK